LKAEPNGIFGRLYYHLEKKYGYEEVSEGRNVKVPFFASFDIPDQPHSIHFPQMMAILAGLRKEHSEARTAMWVSIAALVASGMSGVAAVISLLSP
jgi:hypothetical protein